MEAPTKTMCSVCSFSTLAELDRNCLVDQDRIPNQNSPRFIMLTLLQYTTELFIFAYGFYLSYKALKTPDEDDDSILLSFWLSYSFFSTLETFVPSLFASLIIPLYPLVKLAFFVSLVTYPDTMSDLVFDKIVKTALGSVEERIDALCEGFGVNWEAEKGGENDENQQKDDS